MKRSCLVLLFFLAVAAARGGELVTRSGAAFKDGAKNFEYPSTIMRGVPTRDLIESFTDVTAAVLRNNLEQFHARIFELQRIGVTSIKSVADTLFAKLNRYSFSSHPYLLDEDLKKINDFIHEINKADPEIKHYIFPKIKTPEKELIETFGDDSSADIFKNLPNLVVRNMKSVIPLFHNVFLSGIEKAIPAITEFDNQLRHEYLHGKLVPALIEQIEKINNSKNRIRDNVSRETWANYNNLSNIFLRKVMN